MPLFEVIVLCMTLSVSHNFGTFNIQYTNIPHSVPARCSGLVEAIQPQIITLLPPCLTGPVKVFLLMCYISLRLRSDISAFILFIQRTKFHKSRSLFCGNVANLGGNVICLLKRRCFFLRTEHAIRLLIAHL